MVKIQVSTGYLEVVENTSFPLTFSVADIRDISKKKGGFSKSIELTGSKSNLQQLGHLYNVNIDDATFDVNALTECTVFQNGIAVCERFYLQLLSVNKTQLSPADDELITFTVVVKDSVSDFFTTISTRFLTDLDLSDYDHVFNGTNVKDSFDNTVADGYKYPLMYSPSSTIPIREFRPAFFAKVYLDRIFARANKSYSWAGMSEARFDKTIIPYNSDGGSINPDEYKVQWTKLVSQSTSNHLVNFNQTTPTITATNEIIDNNNNYNPTSGQYTTPFYIATGESINFALTVNANLVLTNTEAGVARPVIFLSQDPPQTTPTTAHYRSFLQILRNGSVVTEVPMIDTGAQYFQIPSLGSINPVNGVLQNTAQISNCNIGDVITFKVRTTGASLGFWSSGPEGDQNTVIVSASHSLDVVITPSANNSGLFSVLKMNSYIPKEIKQSDFVKTIFTMYNLYAIPDEVQPDNIILIHRDEYLDAGKSVDWSKKIDKSQRYTITFLPDLTAKRTILTYKPDKDAVNVAYTEGTNEIFGQVEYTFDSEHTKGDDKKEIIFSPTPSVITTYEAVVPMITGSSPKTNIRILIDSGVDTLPSPIKIQQYSGSEISSSTYPVSSHFENPLQPSFDINFGVCDYYLYPLASVTANNLYNLYWRRTMAQLNSGKMLTAYFNLTESDIQAHRMNDKIFVLNSWWHINQIIDYNANDRTLTKVELISVDDTISLPPFRIKPVRQYHNGDVVTVRNVYDKMFFENNNVVSGGGVVSGVTGKVTNGGIVVKTIETEKINGIKSLFEPRYKFALKQFGTNPPYITKIIQNDFEIQTVITRDSAGVYRFQNMVSSLLSVFFITEDSGFYFRMEDDDIVFIPEDDMNEVITSTLIGATATGNLNVSDYYRFRVDGNDLILETYSGGVLADDVLTQDIPFIVDLFFNELT